MEIGVLLLLLAGGLLLLLLSGRVLGLPLGLLGQVLLNTLMGLGALLLVDALSPFTGLRLGLNLWNSITVGVLGLPGLGLLLLLRLVL